MGEYTYDVLNRLTSAKTAYEYDLPDTERELWECRLRQADQMYVYDVVRVGESASDDQEKEDSAAGCNWSCLAVQNT